MRERYVPFTPRFSNSGRSFATSDSSVVHTLQRGFVVSRQPLVHVVESRRREELRGRGESGTETGGREGRDDTNRSPICRVRKKGHPWMPGD